MIIRSVTDQGTRHSHNQDAMWVSRKGFWRKQQVLCVADGMGGYSHGEQSAAIVIETLQRFFETQRHATDAQIDDAILKAHRKVMRNNMAHDMTSGSTLVLAMLCGNTVTIKNVGDSRAVLISHQTERQLSQDDTVVARLLRKGSISLQQAKTHSEAHALTQCIGIGNPPTIHTIQSHFLPGDCLFLMSDGVYGKIPPGRLVQLTAQLQSNNPDPLDLLITQLRQAQETDDITLIACYHDKSHR